MTFARVLWAGLVLCLSCPFNAYGNWYVIKPGARLRGKPGLQHRIVQVLEHNQTVRVAAKNGNWLEAETLTGQKGYVREDMISDLWVRVHKKERTLFLMKGQRIVKSFRIALGARNPLNDKIRRGDGGTPEGRFFICEKLKNPGESKYGARSLRISYPGIEDARRGLQSHLIVYDQYRSIVKQIKAAKTPPQNTGLGGSIRIHGGGSQSDWTLGCMALEDQDVIELFGQIPEGTRVEIYASGQADQALNRDFCLNAKIWEGAQRLLERPAQYTQAACAIIKMGYPGGDIPGDQAVCTDIVVRALRNAALDLQALVHEDILVHPARYRPLIQKPDYRIDHRRTRNLQIYFENHALNLAKEMNSGTVKEWRPGDIATLDTGIANGTIFDHIGIVDRVVNEQGFPKLINIWTIGYSTDSMDLLGGAYPRIVGHFRMTHPFDYE